MNDVPNSTEDVGAWADGVLVRLRDHAEIDKDLLAALDRVATHREEILARMADAVHAAALGLGPAGCATAAGVPERLLAGWLEQDSAFRAAMAAAQRLSQAHEPEPGGPGTLRPVALRVMLKALGSGSPYAAAANLAGLSEAKSYKYRRRHPRLNALVLAARSGYLKSGRRVRSAAGRGYRLVPLD